MSDEIICSECGRPNLPEAEKCWYCQTSLKEGDKKDEVGLEEVQEETDNPVEEEAKVILKNEEPDKDIPDWLKRVRELKKADQPEEEIDQWRQQILFNKSEEDKEPQKKPNKSQQHQASQKSRKKPRRQSAKKEQPAPVTEANALESPVSPENEPEIKETAEDRNDELPTGFKPLDTKKG